MDNTTPKPRYMIRVIGEQTPLHYSSYRTAYDCMLRYREMGKTALLMQYDPETGDYAFADGVIG